MDILETKNGGDDKLTKLAITEIVAQFSIPTNFPNFNQILFKNFIFVILTITFNKLPTLNSPNISIF
jgi:hypothetical protein